GNPWTGTPAASNVNELPGYIPLATELASWIPGEKYVAGYLGSVPLSPLGGRTLQGVLGAPFAPQLEPGRPFLTSPASGIQQHLGPAVKNLKMILACGTQPQGFLTLVEALSNMF